MLTMRRRGNLDSVTSEKSGDVRAAEHEGRTIIMVTHEDDVAAIQRIVAAPRWGCCKATVKSATLALWRDACASSGRDLASTRLRKRPVAEMHRAHSS